MKFSKPITYALCLLNSASVFAASAAPTVAVITQENKAVTAQVKPVETTLRIASLNGKLNPNHKKEIQMRPRERVTLTADLFVTVKGKLSGLNNDARDFIWQIDKREACDVARGSCNGIEVSHEGISFVLSESMADTVTVKVRLASDAKKTDTLVIRNQTRVEQKAEEARERAEEAAEQARYEEQQQSERNSQIFGAILGAVVVGLSAYGQVKADEQRDEGRQQWQNNNNQRHQAAPAPVVAAPVVTPPAPAPEAPREHGGGRGGEGRGDGNGRGNGQHNGPGRGN